MVRRYRTFYKSERLWRKWEVSVYKPVKHTGHAKEIGIENRCAGVCAQYGPRFSQREHALELDGARPSVFNSVCVGRT